MGTQDNHYKVVDGAPVADLSRRISLLESAMQEAAREHDLLAATCAAQERLIEQLLSRATIQRLGQMEVVEAIDRLKERLTLHAHETASTLYAIQAAQTRAEPLVATTPQRLAYEQMITRIRSLVQRHLPGDATVIVVSKGDDELLKLYGRRGWHFPRQQNGVYAGYHPHSGTAAVVHLEALRAFGGQYFLLPATSGWWLDQYPELNRHLANSHRKVVEEPGVAVIYALDERAAEPQSRSAEALSRVLQSCLELFGEDRPAILDWDTGLHVSELLPESSVLEFKNDVGRHLPYVDDSFAVVALRSMDPVAVTEAERVARLAVVNVDPEANGRAASVYDGTTQTRVAWLRPREQKDALTSIIIPCFNELHHTRICLEKLAETLPAGSAVEVVVVDDGSTDGSHDWLTEHARARDWLRVVRNELNSGFVDAVNLGADAASADLLVLLNNDCIPLPGWLEALHRTFREHDDAGAVGGKLLFPDGRLQEAGGVVFRDGTAAKIGYRDVYIDAPFYNFVRRVDYCSGALLATRRALFCKIGGLDTRYSPAYYEDTDYCFSVREHGLEVYYQNECAVIHVEGATTGNTVTSGAKRHQLLNHEKFVRRWAAVLADQPERPNEPFSAETVHRLIHGERRSSRI